MSECDHVVGFVVEKSDITGTRYMRNVTAGRGHACSQVAHELRVLPPVRHAVARGVVARGLPHGGRCMTLAHHAKRRDANEAEIVQALRDFGVWVQPLQVPFDLLCCFHGVMFGIEVKDGNKPPSQRPLTKSQKDFFKLVELRQMPVFVAININEALQVARDMAR